MTAKLGNFRAALSTSTAAVDDAVAVELEVEEGDSLVVVENVTVEGNPMGVERMVEEETLDDSPMDALDPIEVSRNSCARCR